MKVYAAALSGFQGGFAGGIIAGALLFIARDFGLSDMAQGALASLYIVAALLGCLGAGSLASLLGRKRSLQLGALLFLIGATVSSMLSELPTLLLGRVVTGIAAGISTTIAPLYLAEIAPPEKRGSWVSMNQLGTTVGILSAYLTSLLFASSGNWRAMLCGGIFLALVQLTLLHFAPDSGPVQRTKKAWGPLFARENRRPLFVALTIALIQQITGINAVIYFAPRIFEEAGFASAFSAILATVGVGSVNVAATLLSLKLVDKMGRKPLLYLSLAGMILSLGVMTAALLSGGSELGLLSVTGLMGFIAFFAVGLGPVPWLIFAEVFPSEVRERGMSLSACMGWVGNVIVVFTFLDLVDALTISGALLLFVGAATLSLFFVRYGLHETARKSIKEA